MPRPRSDTKLSAGRCRSDVALTSPTRRPALWQALQDYSCLRFMPSALAAAAVCLARICLCTQPHWSPPLAQYTQYSGDELRPCVLEMHALFRRAATSNLRCPSPNESPSHTAPFLSPVQSTTRPPALPATHEIAISARGHAPLLLPQDLPLPPRLCSPPPLAPPPRLYSSSPLCRRATSEKYARKSRLEVSSITPPPVLPQL